MCWTSDLVGRREQGKGQVTPSAHQLAPTSSAGSHSAITATLSPFPPASFRRRSPLSLGGVPKIFWSFRSLGPFREGYWYPLDWIWFGTVQVPMEGVWKPAAERDFRNAISTLARSKTLTAQLGICEAPLILHFCVNFCKFSHSDNKLASYLRLRVRRCECPP